jgi:protein involved in polysaccharide export with SLBB domain
MRCGSQPRVRSAQRLHGARRLGVRAAALLLPLAWVLPGCGPTHGQLVEFLRSHELITSTGHYTVMPPDAITVHAPGAPEVDGTSQTVRPDGKVALRLLGEVYVAGLTTEEIAEKLKAQLARFYVEPEVVVEMAAYRSQFYYVFGQVRRPGAQRYTGRDTLLKALADAKPTFLAWRSQIRVVRPSPDEQSRKAIIVDLDEMVRSGDVSKNFLLQQGDIIEVPPTPLAWLGLRVRELLFPLEPALRTYQQPAGAIQATNVYENEFGSDSDSDSESNNGFYWD